MKGKIICERCIACGLCQIKAPELFAYDEEGIAHFKNDQQSTEMTISEEDVPAFKAALTHCPTGAIQRLKEKNGE